MTDLTKIGNDSFRKAAKQIISPTMNAGGTDSDVMVVLESTIATVLLTLNQGDARKAAGMLDLGLVPGVTERLSKFTADQQRKDQNDD